VARSGAAILAPRTFAEVVGEALRRARRARGLTFRAVRDRSGGRFKPSTLGGYERGERSISLERFCDLAEAYAESPDVLLAEVLQSVRTEDLDAARSEDEGPELVIDLNRISLIDNEERGAVETFVRDVQAHRGDFEMEALTLRSGDLEVIASSSGMDEETLLEKLRPALRKPVRKVAAWAGQDSNPRHEG
jgi:transcriptional regulator with XRE-family HTH domain